MKYGNPEPGRTNQLLNDEGMVRERNQVVGKYIPWLAFACAGLLLVIVLQSLWWPVQNDTVLKGSLTLGIVVLFTNLAIGLMARKIVLKYSPMLILIITLLTSLAIGFLTLESNEFWNVTYLAMALVVAGVAQLRPFWFISTAVGVWVVYLALGLATTSSYPYWRGWGTVMLVSTVISCIIQYIRYRENAKLENRWAKAKDESTTDPLTGLLNRRGLQGPGQRQVQLALDSGKTISVSFCDVVGLKKVNDSAGHDAGDAIITAVADALLFLSRDSDMLARWGGDEFVMLSFGSGPPPPLFEKRLTSYLGDNPPVSKEVWLPEVTVGQITAHIGETPTLDKLIEQADQSMYDRRAYIRSHQK